MPSAMEGFDHFPQDIFREIIQYAYVHSPAQQDHDAHYQLVVPSPPIVASHVCRSWRRVLLSDPTMWTCILVPQLKPDGIMELLRRSDSALLNVFLELNASRKLKHGGTSNMLSTLFQQIHRFKTLYVHVLPMWSISPGVVNRMQVLIKQIMPYLQRPAPELQFFCFKHIEFVAPAANLGETFLDTLFSGDAPNLKHIHRGFLEGDLRQPQPNPLFRDLSELYLTMAPNDSFVVDSDLLLDFFELSPCLKLFSLQVTLDQGSDLGATCPRDRKINLPHLQRLVLNVDRAVELMDVLLNHLSFPSNIGWKVTSGPVELGTLPPLLQLLSQAQFTSLRILSPCDDILTFSFKENRNPTCIDLVDNHELIYVYDDTCHITDFWDLLLHSVKTSSITHVEFGFGIGTYPSKPITFQTILTSLKNLETLFVRQHCDPNNFSDDDSCLVCLSALIPKSEHSAASKRNSLIRRTTNSITSFPCPLLREITVELEEPLNKMHATVFRACSNRRQAEGYPLQLFVRCPEIEDTILDLEEYSSIHVSIVPESDDEY